MLIKVTLLLTLFAAVSLAIPSPRERLQARVNKRLSWPKKSSVLHPELSSNWAGAVLNEDSGTFTNVSATITVPNPTLPAGAQGSESHAASAWVGIDGDTCDTAILQTGIDFTVDADGSVSYDAWYEWFPQFAFDFTGIDFSAGDSVALSVQSSNTTSGTATIINLTTGQLVTQDIASTQPLCQQDAEWIVEDFEDNGAAVPFADFGTVTFDNALAQTPLGPMGPSKANLIVIEQGGQTLTNAAVGTSSVTVSYEKS